MEIIVDVHEGKEVKASWRENFPSHTVTFKELEAGDITTPKRRTGFEYKTPDDFYSSIVDGRLPELQCAKLLAMYESSFIVVSGTIDMNDVRIRATFASCFARGVPVIQFSDFFQMQLGVINILEKMDDGKDRSVSTLSINHKFKQEPQISVLLGINGIEWELATRLLEKFKTVRNVMYAAPQQLMEVKGVGEVKAFNIEQALCQERIIHPSW